MWRSCPAVVAPDIPEAQRCHRSLLDDHLVSALRLPLVRSRILPGYLLVADRNNDRVLLLSPDGRIVWRRAGLREPDDAFFTPGYRGIITNEEFDDTLRQISLRTRRIVWSYGHAGVPGRGSGYLNAPDDAYRLANGTTTVADIRNCRIVQLRHDGSVLRVLGGSCVHDPPRGFASPNGDTPLSDGGILVTEIGGWVDRLDRSGRLVWSVRTPFTYPSDAQLLPNGHILVCAFTTPGRVVEMTRAGRIVWSFGATSGKNRLDRPSLAIRLPNGLVAVNDDWRHRVVLVDPRTSRIVWQYGHTDVASAAPGYLDKPDGMDFLPASATVHAAFVARPVRRLPASPRAQTPAVDDNAHRIASVSDFPTSSGRASGRARSRARRPGGRGLVIADPRRHAWAPRTHRVASVPDARRGRGPARTPARWTLFGGGESVSSPAVVRDRSFDGQCPTARLARRAPLRPDARLTGLAVIAPPPHRQAGSAIPHR